MSIDHEALIDAWADNTLDDTAIAELDQWLCADASHGVEFVRSMMLYRHLRTLPMSQPIEYAPASSTAARPWRMSVLYALAAMIVLVFTVWFLLAPDSQSPTPSRSAPQSRSVATLTNLEKAQFVDTTGINAHLGDALAAGPIELASGKAQVMFDSTAVVDLTGPCEFEMIGPNRGRLMAGSLAAYVPDRAQGFTVDLPGGARVIDLGTVFALSVGDHNAVRLRVLKGRVRFIPPVNDHGAREYELVGGQNLTYASDVVQLTEDNTRAALVVELDADAAISGQILNTGREGPREIGLPDDVRLEQNASNGLDAWLRFNGRQNAHLVIGELPLFQQPVKTLTAMAWIRLADLQQADLRHLIHASSGSVGLPSGFVISVDRHGALQASLRGSDGLTHAAASVGRLVHPDRWHHMAVVFDLPRHQILLYLDGKQVGAASIPLGVESIHTDSDTQLVLGRLPGLNANLMKGDLDEFRLFDAALTSEQIALWARSQGTLDGTPLQQAEGQSP